MPTENSEEISGTEEDIVFVHRGENLTLEQASTLENSLAPNGYSVATRLMLLGYYEKQKTQKCIDLWLRHAIWFIINRPSDYYAGYLYPPANLSKTSLITLRTTWEKTIEIHKLDSRVLGNAGKCYIGIDRDFSQTLFERADAIDPENLTWSRYLAKSYAKSALKHAEPEIKRNFANLAYERGEKIIEIDVHRGEKFDVFQVLSALARELNDFQKSNRFCKEAEKIADEMGLWHTCVYGCYGLTAFRSGDIAAAKVFLKKLGRLGFQRNKQSLELAQLLLEHGERDSVQGFLTACLRPAKEYGQDSTSQDRANIRDLRQEIKNGATPKLIF